MVTCVSLVRSNVGSPPQRTPEVNKHMHIFVYLMYNIDIIPHFIVLLSTHISNKYTFTSSLQIVRLANLDHGSVGHVGEQVGDALSVVGPPYRLGKHHGHVNDL